MRYSILTPTLVRNSLKRLCDSIDSQSSLDWEHIVVVDSRAILTAEQWDILASLGRAGRRVYFNAEQHPPDYGNAARRLALDQASGEYVLGIDDDDFYADPGVLKTLECVTGTWAIYPVLARGQRCYYDPPKIHGTGTAMFMYRRDTGCRFPANTDYSADGQLVEELKSKFPYQALPHLRPLVIYERANVGRTDAEIIAAMPKGGKLKYASDGLTIDWHDNN